MKKTIKGNKKRIKEKKTKKLEEKKVEDKENENKLDEKRIVYAKARYIPGSPRKARLVVDLIRGRNAEEVLLELDFIRKRASRIVQKVIKSAVANAVNNFEMDRKNLVVVDAYVDKAPTYKRGRAGSRGRYKKILKRNSNIVVGVAEKNS